MRNRCAATPTAGESRLFDGSSVISRSLHSPAKAPSANDLSPPVAASAAHEARLDAVAEALIASGARSVADLGCGSGDLLVRLAARHTFTTLLGIDVDPAAVAAAHDALSDLRGVPHERVQVHCASFETPDRNLAGFDAAAMVETIEHLHPGRLSRVEESVFGQMRPELVLVTTPNQEFNVLHGLRPGERRHRDHRFEWPRARFRQWARGVAGRNGYRARFVDIGPADPLLGASTQMARFERTL